MRIEHLKVGDKVHVHRGYHAIPSVAVIDSETKTSWRVGKTLYTKTYGFVRGGGPWSTEHITPFDADKEALYAEERKRKILIARMGAIIWGALTNDQLERMAAISKESSQ